jgi:hypothetical protein
MKSVEIAQTFFYISWAIAALVLSAVAVYWVTNRDGNDDNDPGS